MELSTLPVAIIMISLYIICPIILRLTFKNKKVTIILLSIMATLFSIVLFIGVFTKVTVTQDVIKISLNSKGHWASETINFNIFNLSTFDLCVNTIMLIPFGVILALALNYRNKKMPFWKLLLLLFLCGILFGFMIELIQFILPIERAIQLSDVFLNAISCVIGGLYFTALLKIKKEVK